MKWTQEEAIKLCKQIEAFCPKYGAHVALTGGCLYGEADRKDVDILFYQSEDNKKIQWDGLLKALGEIGFYHWPTPLENPRVRKAYYQDKVVDIFNPLGRGNYHED